MDRRILLLALPLAVACTTKSPSVTLGAVCAPPVDATQCSFADTCEAQYIGTIGLDVSRANQLFLVVEAVNQAARNDDSTAGRVVTGTAYAQEVRVTYAGPLAIPATTYRIAQTVPTNGTSVLAFPVLDVAGGTTLPAGVTSAVVVAKVTLKGVFGDGDSFESPEREIPIVVSDDCLGNACAGGALPTASCPSGVGTARASQRPNSYECP